VLGGWSFNWIARTSGRTANQHGCPHRDHFWNRCNVLRVAGQSQQLGIQNKAIAANGGVKRPFWFNNAAAFNQPCQLGQVVHRWLTGRCVPLQAERRIGSQRCGQPGVQDSIARLLLVQAIKINERFSAQFRAEFFNILNHPNFNAPGFAATASFPSRGSTNYTDAHFGEVGSTRDAPTIRGRSSLL